MRIVIFADRDDTLARQLAKRIASQADCIIVPLRDCSLTTGSVPIAIPGYDGSLPDAAFVRTVQAGTFEAVTMRLGMLHLLRECGVAVWNDARAIERCVDKSMTSALLAGAGLATPRTLCTQSRERAAAYCDEAFGEGRALVVKPLFGSQGRGVRLIGTTDELPQGDEVAGVWYLQDFVQTGDGSFHDHRLLVCAGAVIGAMTRHGSTFVTNMKQGGRAVPLAVTAPLRRLAIAAAAATGADYAGVDIIVGKDGKALVLEVNSMPAWSGVQSVTRRSIAGTIAQAFLNAARLRKPVPARSLTP